jgi:stage II sporulation protein D
MAILICLVFLFTLIAAPAEALPERVKVRLFSSAHGLNRIFIYGPVKILEPRRQDLGSGLFVAGTTGGGVTLRSASGRKQAVISHAARIVLTGLNDSAQVYKGELVKLGAFPAASPRFYRGTVSIQSAAAAESSAGRVAGANQIALINDVDCRSYIAGCVGSESPPAFGLEALKAQAVLSTTLLAKSYRGKPIDDSTEMQSYLGASGERAPVLEAVKSVFGQELCFDGRPIDVFFFSTCGGTTARPDIFGGPVKAGRYPYLKAVNCLFCKESPFFKEHRESITANAFLQSTGMRNPLVVADDHGRPTRVSFEMNGHSRALNGYQFWLVMGRHFGWGVVPSTCFKIEQHQSSRGDQIEFVSRGCGHGVGMCQWGAYGQDKAGRGYKEILYFYFPGTSLKTITGRHFTAWHGGRPTAAKVAGGQFGYHSLASLLQARQG